jgi:hypothetical protein
MRLISKRPVTYEATRLLFKADVIERLAFKDRFRVITPVGSFEMTRADFYEIFENVVHSRSYRDKGIYHYPVVPRKAEQFRRA